MKFSISERPFWQKIIDQTDNSFMKISGILLLAIILSACSHDHDEFKGKVGNYVSTNIFKILSNADHLNGERVVFSGYLSQYSESETHASFYLYLSSEHAEKKLVNMSVSLDPMPAMKGTSMKSCSESYVTIWGRMTLDPKYGYPNFEPHKVRKFSSGEQDEMCFYAEIDHISST